jgi:SRSO17 transposase
MSTSERFEEYMGYLAQGSGHADRRAGRESYCTGLILPLSRKKSCGVLQKRPTACATPTT